MQSTDDGALLRQFAETGSDEAFAALVRRHVNLVYSVALRQLGDPHHAEEVSQAVFVILAKKASQVRHDKALSSWLFQVTRLTANNFLRSEIRRQRREQEAHMRSILNEPAGDAWPVIAPLLDTAVAALGEKDRRAVVLRFYEGRNLREVGAALGASEGAAEKRVGRAVEKLRVFFAKRGVVFSAAVLTTAISTHSVHAAPPTLATTATALAVAKGATSSTSTLTLIKGALKIMAWTKAKTAIVVSAVVLITAGTATVTVIKTGIFPDDSWRVPKINNIVTEGDTILNKARPQVRIVPSKYTHWVQGTPFSEGDSTVFENGKFVVITNQSRSFGIGVQVADIVEVAYNGQDHRTVMPAQMPRGLYDFIANLPRESMPVLQEQIKNKFGLVGKREMRETDVYVLKLSRPEIHAFKPANSLKSDLKIDDPYAHSHSGPRAGDGTYKQYWFDITLKESLFINSLEAQFELPIVDDTQLTNQFDFSFTWPVYHDNSNEAHKQIMNLALLNQLGLELVPARREIEMLVVEKVN